MDEVRAFIAERNLLGPPFDEVLDDLSASIAQDLATPLPLTEADRGVDFRDERIVKGWGDWEQEKWEKLEVTSEQLEEMKRTRGKLLGERDEESLLEPGWTMPWWPEESEVVLSRQAQRAARPASPFTAADTEAQMKELLEMSEPMEEPEDDEDMRRLGEMPDINVALDLKLEATPEQIAFVKAYAAANKLAGQKSALQSLLEDDRVDLATLALPEEYRAPSPPLFARPSRPKSPALVDLAKLAKDEDVPGPLQIPSSPTGRGISMRDWNKEEYILNLPSSSTLPPSEGPIWSSPAPPLALDESSRDLEDYKLEPPLFPRTHGNAANEKKESSLLPAELADMLSSRHAQVDDSAEDEEIDELADDDALQADLNLTAGSLASLFASDDTIGSDDHPHSLLIDAYIKPPKLPPPRPSSPVSLSIPPFAPSTDSSMLRSIAEPGALSLELETSFHNVKLDSLEDLIDDDETSDIEQLRAQAIVLRDGLTKPRQDEESLVERSEAARFDGGEDQDEADEPLVARHPAGDASKSTDSAQQRIAEAAPLEKDDPPIPPKSRTLATVSPHLVVASTRPTPRAPAPVAPRTPPPRWSPPPHRGQLSAPSKLETGIFKSTNFPVTNAPNSLDEPASDFIYPASFVGSPSVGGSDKGAEVDELELRDVELPSQSSSTLKMVEDDSSDVQEKVAREESNAHQVPRAANPSAEALSNKTASQRAKHQRGAPRTEKRATSSTRLASLALQGSQEPELGWSSSDALARFLSTRGRASKIDEGRRPATPRLPTPNVPSSEPKLPPSHHSSPPPDSIPFSVPPFLTSPVTDANPSTGHRIVAFPRLLQKHSHLQALRSANIEIVHRRSRLQPEPHLLLDGSTCVVFHALNKLVGAVYRQQELEVDSLPTNRDPAVFTTLHRLSHRFDRILLLLEESETTSPPNAPARMKPYAYTPPVLTALRQLANAIEQHGREGVAIEVVLSKSPTHSATITRQLLEHLKHEMLALSDVGLWDERAWLRDDPTEDENALLQLPDLTELTAMWILSRCDLETFLDLGAEDRERAFRQVIASDRLLRISTTIDANRQQPTEAPSSPRSFAELEATADDALPQVDMLAEAVDWAAYDQA